VPSALKAALALASRGLAVFPVIEKDKKPACPHGVKEATKDAAVITAWWQENPQFNVAVATGSVSSIFVVDVDGPKGELALDEFEQQLGKYPATIETTTPRPGRHIWFKLPTGITIKCSTGKVAEGLDIRGEGGYAIVPPSVHPNGNRYRWSIDCAKRLADPPQWLVDKIAAVKNGNGHVTPPSEWRRLATDGVDEGQRDDSITRLTGYLLRRYLDPGVVRELVSCWNEQRCRPPLPPEDIDRIIASIAGREQGKRNGHR
jgi:hypothetical protein